MLSPAPSALLLKTRIVAAIRGAIVADAATMGLHWIYDPSELLQRVVGEDRTPEFVTPPQPNFYSSDDFRGHYQAGMSSPYGELLVHTAQHVASVGPMHLSGYTASKALYAWAKSFGGRPDSALQQFMETYETKKDTITNDNYTSCGADDHQAMIYAKVVPVTCLYAGQTELVDKLEQVIRAHQNNDEAVAFGVASARLLEAVLLGAPLDQALATCYENNQNDADIKKAYEWARAAAATGDSLEQLLLKLSHDMMKDTPDSPFYNFAARSCSLPQAFMGPLALFYKPNLTYKTAVRENILAAGDNCSRSMLVGAVYGALEGQVPEDWFGKCFHIVQDASTASAKQISTLRTGIE